MVVDPGFHQPWLPGPIPVRELLCHVVWPKINKMCSISIGIAVLEVKHITLVNAILF